MQTIVIGTSSYGLVTIPTTPGPADIEIGMNDAVASVLSPFTRTEQVQAWPGGDYWDATITLPPLTRAQAASWRGFLAELSGRQYVMQLGDATASGPLGTVRGAPVVDSTNLSNNLPMTKSLVTRGWAASAFRLLLPGDQFQIGYRLHMVTEVLNSDSTGAATVSIWPSLREQPGDGTALVLRSPKGLFRLAQNRRVSNWSPTRLTTVSLKCVEAK